MARVTIYIDDHTEKRLAAAARAKNISKSKWNSMLNREKTESDWPNAVVQLAGAWKDFPSLEEIRSGMGEDAPRKAIECSV